MHITPLESAYELMEKSFFTYEGRIVGCVAAMGTEELSAANYQECFIRDFVPTAIVLLAEGRSEIVRNFLETVLTLRTQERSISGHEIQPGVMPASFRVEVDEGKERLVADFGERAIGRVAPVDSMMWWLILFNMYIESTGDRELAKREDFQGAIRQILHLCLKDSFEVSPALLVPDGCSMIDRRMGIYGHPLEIQSLFFGMLRTVQSFQADFNHIDDLLLKTALTRKRALRNYLRIFYWLDLARLNEIHRYTTEEFGPDSINMLNIYPESIPGWVIDWLPGDSGYLVGNVGAGRMDFRFFSLGNLLAILFGLTTQEQSESIIRLFDTHWQDLIGAMPIKICYPAMYGLEWQVRTGCDPKNTPWSYQNGGSWPALLWFFVAAAIKMGRGDLAERAYNSASEKLLDDQWPEYYDGRLGRLIGRRSNYNQVWSATSVILSHKLLENPELISLFPGSMDIRG